MTVGRASFRLRVKSFRSRKSAPRPARDRTSYAPERSVKKHSPEPELMIEDGAFPAADVDALRESGLLTAALPSKCGSKELTGVSLSETLRSIGSGSLPLGRLFEGHVNALELVLRYGNRDQIEMFGGEAREGKLFGVWNTDEARIDCA